MKPKCCDVLVIGGGALGLSAAYHLALRGIRVTVLERERLPGAHASGRNAGMIRQLYRHAQLTDWASRSIRSWPAGLRSCFQQTGSFVVGRMRPSHHEELFEERVLPITRGGRKTAAPAVYCASDGLLDSPAYMNALLQLCRASGAEVRLNENAESMESVAERFFAPIIINAAGAWANRIGPLPLQPYARHLFVVSGFPPDYMPAAKCGFYWDEVNEWYLRQWDTTSRLVSICERLPADPESFVPLAEQTERLAEMLLASLPEVASSLAVTHSWHCFRTYADDQLPVIGFDESVPSLFWLSAFGGFGMSTSFAAAEDAARIICGETCHGLTDFSPGRLTGGRPAETKLLLAQRRESRYS